jgi:hypothetical protein
VTFTYDRQGDIGMDSSRCASFRLLVLLFASLTWLPSAQAQQTSLPEGAARIGKQQVWWTGQLRMAKQTGERALVGLQSTPVDDAIPIEETVLQAARDTYVLIRAAKAGMEIFKGEQKYPDPLTDIALRRVTEAWNLARTPVDKVSWGLSRQQYLALAVQDLGKSLRLLDQTLILLP